MKEVIFYTLKVLLKWVDLFNNFVYKILSVYLVIDDIFIHVGQSEKICCEVCHFNKV